MGQRATKSVLKRYKGRARIPRAGKPTPQRQTRRSPPAVHRTEMLRRPRKDRGRRVAFTGGGEKDSLSTLNVDLENITDIDLSIESASP